MASELEAHIAGDHDDTALVRVENTHSFITLDALHTWLTRSQGEIHVTPVIDTDANLHITRYEIPDRIRRHSIREPRPAVQAPPPHKTHARWTYTQLEPAVYLWRSPTGTRRT